ncbi:patatin-like phospholipase domain-containing protein 2 isoform X4 [Anguilla anguilla]|uniref:patatin-like phospholipase domain-containing protein 2 isoform X4 n=1 Tax=Anguilla anguilla TaxID=7936 RepID=UPI0015A8F5DA|nr:patatin-like phospholipase domain-containing protein 2 isoform X4 [Anguilla anguilla]
MFDFEGEWSISFAGCGFLGIYYVGLSCCFLERAPFLLKGVKRIYGASSGALTATVLILGLPLVNCCRDLMVMAKAARVRRLGPLHPSCNLAKIVRDSLDRDLPEDAHVLATGRLCVSLTRMSDGQNVIVSEFGTRQELIQALVCSCFIPGFFGLIPPSFRGVRYMDGALSNNQPQYQLKDTLTVAPFCGDCVICPRDDGFSLRTVRVCSASYRVSLRNLRRLARVFFPPDPKVMAEICQSGYKDGLQFLKDNNLLTSQSLCARLSAPDETGPTPAGCCGDEDDALEPWTNEESSSSKDGHWWLDEQTIDCLPVPIKKVLCEACREKHSLYAQVTDLLPVRVASYMLLPYTLPVQSAYSLAQRLVRLIPAVAEEVKWLFETCGELYRQTLEAEGLEAAGEAPLCWDSPPALDLRPGEDSPPRCLAAEATPPCLSDSVSIAAGKSASPPAAVNAWTLFLGWVVGWMSPVTFDPTL